MTRSRARKAKNKSIIKTIEEAAEKSRDSLEKFIRRVKPAEKPTMVPDDFGDFDEAYEQEDDWEMGEGSDFEDMDVEDAIMEDLGELKLRF
jgi:hypothetical protein